MVFKDKTIVITGGTGSLGKSLVNLLISRHDLLPKKIVVFSRDEAKQHSMKLDIQQKYPAYSHLLQFKLGDIRNYQSVCSAVEEADILINTAALKQVPSCEYFPYEAVQTNIIGAQNIVRAIRENKLRVKTVVGVSTDKACKPVNVMGMTKAIQERIFIQANQNALSTKFVCVRYGNVLASRGSVIPIFHKQINTGGPVTITDPHMTRFLLPMKRAIETVIAAVQFANPGEIFIPIVSAARVEDIVKSLIEYRDIAIQYIGTRPGEKVHEILVSMEEVSRTYRMNDFYVIKPLLTELASPDNQQAVLKQEYSSSSPLMSLPEIDELLSNNNLKIGQELLGD